MPSPVRLLCCFVVMAASIAGRAQVTPPSATPGGMPGAQTQSQSTAPSNLPAVQTSPPQTGLSTDPGTGLQQAPQQAVQAARVQGLAARAAGSNPTDCPDPNVPIYPGSGANSAVASGDSVMLERTLCRGTCPAYTVQVNADGSVQWTGKAFVVQVGGASGQVDPVAATRLIRDFRDHGFVRLCGGYSRAVTDSAAAITTLSIGHQTNHVRVYADGGPSWLAELDLRMDALANTHAWRHGEPVSERFGETRLIEDTVMPKPGVTPLMKAAAADRVDEIATLLASGQPIDAEDASGWTALMYAAGPGRLSTVQYLLGTGAKADHRSRFGETVLFAAATSSDEAAAKLRLLLQSGAAINLRAADGSTVLMTAARHFWIPDLLQTLLALGADVSAKNNAGQTALDVLDQREQRSSSPAEYEAARTLLVGKAAAPASSGKTP